jgi:hypothetical protein
MGEIAQNLAPRQTETEKRHLSRDTITMWRPLQKKSNKSKIKVAVGAPLNKTKKNREGEAGPIEGKRGNGEGERGRR